MARQLKNFLDAYLKYTFDSEPPQIYHIWSCLSMVAGALERKCYIKWGRQTLYSNLFVILVGPSGRARKGTAIAFTRPIMEKAKVKVIEGAITQQALIRRMSNAVQNYNDKTTGRVKFQCAVTFLSEELSVFMGQRDIALLAALCNWYDCPDEWKYDTKNMGTDRIQGVFFNLLGGTAPEWLPSMLPIEAVGGGFTSRVLWIVAEDKRKTVITPSYDKELELLLVHDLQEIRLMSGQMIFDDEAHNAYAAWYTKEDKEISKGNPPIQDPKFAGYCERRASTIKKLSMLVCAMDGNKYNITLKHFNKALKLLIQAEKRMAKAFSGLGQSRYNQATELIMSFIIKRKIVTRSQILRFLYRDIDDYTLEIVARTLERMHVIKVMVNEPRAGEITYRLVEKT